MRVPTAQEIAALPNEMRRKPLLALTDAESIWLLMGHERPLQPAGFVTGSGQIVEGSRVVAALNAWMDKRTPE